MTHSWSPGRPSREMTKRQRQHTEWRTRFAPLFPRLSYTTPAYHATCSLVASVSPLIAQYLEKFLAAKKSVIYAIGASDLQVEVPNGAKSTPKH